MLDNTITDVVPSELGGLNFELPPTPQLGVELPAIEPQVGKPTDFLNVLDSGLDKPATWEAKTAPETFNWEESGIDRFIQSPNFKQAGFDPWATPIDIDGRIVNANEERYGNLQTVGERAWNGIIGGGALMFDTAYKQAAQWKNTVRALTDLVTGQGWEQAKKDFLVSPEEIEQSNREQQELMNKYAIFHTDYGNNHLLSSEYLFDNIQQFGFGAGAGLEMAGEIFATWGIGRAFSLARTIGTAARVTETGVEATRLGETIVQTGIKTGEELEKAGALRRANGVFTPAETMGAAEKSKLAVAIQEGSDITKNRSAVEAIWRGMTGMGKAPVPGFGIIGGIGEIGEGITTIGRAEGAVNGIDIFKAGAGNWSAWKGGIGTMSKELSMFNMATTQAKLEAYNTYGQQYADLINQYEEEHDGQFPDAEELNRIRNNAWMAAGDKFTLDLGLIMTMGKIEWGSLYSKFGSAKRLIREAESEAIESGQKSTFTVRGKWVEGASRSKGLDFDQFSKTGKIIESDLGTIVKEEVGKEGQKAYKKITGMFPAIRTLNVVRKDFGLGTALWEAAKVWGPSLQNKFAVAEGLEEVLQNVSDKTFREYYKNQYNGGTDINGNSFIDAVSSVNWIDATTKEFGGMDPGGGIKTFIMGATSGAFMTPIHQVGNWANTRLMSKISPDVKNAMEYKKSIIDEQLKLMNSYYKNPNSALNLYIDALKTAGAAANGMAGAPNKLIFHNLKGDLFSKTVATFIKSDNYDSFMYTLRSMGNMTESDFYEAFPAMKPTDGSAPRSPKQIVNELADSITSYYNRFNKFKDEFAGTIRPEYFEGRGAKELKEADAKREEAYRKLEEDAQNVKFGEDAEKLSVEERELNKAKQVELLERQKQIEKEYSVKTSKNRYFQELMKKRVLDEAIEVLATTDHNVHESVQRMLSIVNQISQINGLGTHADSFVKVLGDKVSTKAEMLRLKDIIKILEEGGSATGKDSTGKEIKDQIAAYKKQLEFLNAWDQNLDYHESHYRLTDEEKKALKEMDQEMPEIDEIESNLNKAYEGYVNSLNQGIGTSPVIIDKLSFNKSFNLLLEHMNLSKDYKHYMDCLNVLANPRGFNQLHDKIYDAIKHTMFDFYVRQRFAILGHLVNKQQEEARTQYEAEQERLKAETLRAQQEAVATEQIGKLSEMLANIEIDIQALQDEKPELEKRIADADARAKEIEDDLEALKELLADSEGESKQIKKEFKKIEQSLRAKLKYLKFNLEQIVARRDAVNDALQSMTMMKNHYSRAIAELEKTKKPFEDINNLTEEDLQKVSDLQFTTKPNLVGLIQSTEQELEMLDARIAYYQSVVDNTQKAIQDLLDFVIFTDKGGALQQKFIAKHAKQARALKTKFDNYTKDLADAKAYKDKVLAKYERLTVTRTARQALIGMEQEMNYIRFIKTALNESNIDPDPEYGGPEEPENLGGPEGPTPLPKLGPKDTEIFEPKIEKTETEIEEEKKKHEEITNNIADHFTEEGDTKKIVLTPEAQAEFESFSPEAKIQLEDLSQIRKDSEVIVEEDWIKQQAYNIINKERDAKLPILSYPQYTDVPHIEWNKEKKRWELYNPNGTSTNKWSTSKAEINDALKEIVLKKHPEAKELSDEQKVIYEDRNAKIRQLEKEYRDSWATDKDGNYIQERQISRAEYIREVNAIEKQADMAILNRTNLSEEAKQLKSFEWFERRLIESITDVSKKDATEPEFRINKLEGKNSFGSKEEAVEFVKKYIQNEKDRVVRENLPTQMRNFEEEQNAENELFKNSPELAESASKDRDKRVNFSDINSIAPLKDANGYKDEELKEFLSQTPVDTIMNGMTIDVVPNTQYNQSADVEGTEDAFFNPTKGKNPKIRQRRSKFVYLVKIDGKHVFTLTPNAAFYEFNIGTVKEPKWITTDNSEFKDDNIFDTQMFAQFFNISGDKVGTTLAAFKNEVNKVNRFVQQFNKKGTVSNDKVYEHLSFALSNSLNYSSSSRLPNTFGELMDDNSGLTFAGVIIDNGMSVVEGKKPKYIRGNQELENELAAKTPVPEKNKGQYTAAFTLPNGEVRWVELSPKTLGEVEATARIKAAVDILAAVPKDEELSQTQRDVVNKIFETIFIATNPYEEGIDYLSQKFKITGGLSIDEAGNAKMTLYVRDSNASVPKSQKKAAGLVIDKFDIDLGRFEKITDAQSFLNKVNYELANYALEKEEAAFVRNIVAKSPLTINQLKEQVDSDSIDSIKKMKTNVHLDMQDGAVIPNSGIISTLNWGFTSNASNLEPAMAKKSDAAPAVQEPEKARTVNAYLATKTGKVIIVHSSTDTYFDASTFVIENGVVKSGKRETSFQGEYKNTRTSNEIDNPSEAFQNELNLTSTYKAYLKSYFIANGAKQEDRVLLKDIAETKVAEPATTVGTPVSNAEARKALIKLKTTIEKTDDLAPIMDSIFKVIDEGEYKAFQETFTEEELSKELIPFMENVETEEEVYNIIGKFSLSRFIDKKLSELNISETKPTAGTTTPVSARTYEQVSAEYIKAIEENNAKRMVELQLELSNLSPNSNTYSDMQKSETDNPDATTPTEEQEEKAVGKKMTAAERRAAKDAQFKKDEEDVNKIAPKYIKPSEHFNQKSVENIDKFIDWCLKNLPKNIISVVNLGELSKNLKAGNITVGQFLTYLEGANVKGRIEVFQNTPWKYHEAFHGVFRLLLDQKTINKLLKEAEKENPITPEKLKKFREDGYIYSGQEEKDRFYEEYLADKFDAWKTNRKEATTTLGKFFQAIADLFKEIWAKLTGSQIEGMFYELNRGKYRHAKLADNQFTALGVVSETKPAAKVIYLPGYDTLPNGQKIRRTLPQDVADRYSRTIAGEIVQAVRRGTADENTIFNEIVSKYHQMLDPIANEDFYNQKADENFNTDAEKDIWFGKLDDHFDVFDDPTARQALKESVAIYLRGFNIRLNMENNAIEEYQEKTSNTAENFDKESTSFGGWGNLNAQARQIIGSATYTLSRDEFFNATFRDGSPITQSPHVAKVYKGLLMAMSNQANQVDALQNLVNFALDTSNSNPETTAFTKYILNEVGFNYEAFSEGVNANNCFTEDGNPALLHNILKAFDQQNLDYLFTAYDESMTFKTFHANTKDAAYYQMKIWNEHFDNLMRSGTVSAKPLEDLMQLFDKEPMSTTVIMKGKGNLKGVLQLSKEIKATTGLDLHPDFLLYSILKHKEMEDPELLKPDQKKFINSHSVSDRVEESILQNVITTINKKENIFSKTAMDERDSLYTDASLNKWATGNAAFKEDINTLSFKSADKKDKWGSIEQNSIGQLVIALNNPNWLSSITDIEKLMDMADNYFMGNKKFETIVRQRKLRLLAADGMREMIDVGSEGEKSTEKKSADGVTFGGMNGREFIAYVLGLYNVIGQPDSVIYKGSRKDFFVTAIPLRINAEKKSLYSVKLPVIECITSLRGGGIKIGAEAMPILFNMVNREYNNIKRLNDAIKALDGKEFPTEDRIEGWNTGEMRGLKLDLTAEWFSPELREKIEKGAKDKDFKLSSLKEEIESSINDHFMQQVTDFAERMVEEGLISKEEEGEYSNILAPEYLFNAFDKSSIDSSTGVATVKIDRETSNKMYLKDGKFMYNLAQVLMNHFINSTEFNNILRGNESKLFKNKTDPTKRESSMVGTYTNITSMFTDPNLAIDHTIEKIHGLCIDDTSAPTQFSKKQGSIKTDDGQMYITTKGLRYVLFGTGKLDAFKANLLDKLLAGKSVTEKEFFGGVSKEQGMKGLKDRGAFNSLKLLFADGRVTLKCSAFTLLPELTSVYDKETNKWEPLHEGLRELHDLRLKMEAYERGEKIDADGTILDEKHEPTIVFAYPKSVSKTMTRNVAQNVADISHTNFEPLDPKFMGNQLENVSNKLQGTEKSQPDYLITSGHVDTDLFVNMGGKTMSVKEVIDSFHDAKSLKLTNDWENAINTLFVSHDGKRIKLGDKIDLSKVDVKMGDFLNHIRENLEMEGTDAQLLDFLEVKNGKPVYNINFPAILPKITANLFTMLSKGVLQGKLPELSLALVSGAKGLGTRVKEVTSIWTQADIDKYSKQGHTKITQELLGQPKAWRVVTNDEVKADYKKYKNAKQYDKSKGEGKRLFSNLQVGDYIIDELRHNFPEFHIVKGKEEIMHYVSEYIRPAHYREEMKGVVKDLQYAFGVRIPADAKHSMINLKMVDTVSVALGSIGIFPHEIIEIAGPDFDIDKEYIHIYDTYSDNKGNRVAYGTATTANDKFTEYKTWMLENNRAFKNALKELLKKDEAIIQKRIEKMNLSKQQSSILRDIIDLQKEGDYKDTMDEMTKMDYLMEKNEAVNKYKAGAKDVDAINKALIEIRAEYENLALKQLGLPHDVKSFEKAGGEKLNNGVQNNRLLDAKMALLGNKNAIKQQDTPTTTQSIKDVITSFIKEFAGENSEFEERLYAQLTEKNTDINSLLGMLNDRMASKVGVDAIGAIANGNMVYALNNEKANKLLDNTYAVKIDGVTFNSFANADAIGSKEIEVISDTIGALLNLFADQPKDRDASKLGLDTKSAGLVVYEVAKGMPLNTALLYTLQPIAVQYIKKSAQLDGELKTTEEKKTGKTAYLKTLIKELEDAGAQVIENFTTDMLIENIKEGGTDINKQYTVLKDIQKMDTQGTVYMRINRVLKLIQGFDATIAEFDSIKEDLYQLGIVVEKNGSIREMDEAEWKELLKGPDAPCIDMRSILMDKKHFLSSYIKTVAQLDALLPAIFIESTPQMKAMVTSVLANTKKKFGPDGEKFSKKVTHDMLSYFGLKAYVNYLEKSNNPYNSVVLSTLNNNMLYAVEGQENRGILDILDDLKTKLLDAGIKNDFLEFIFSNDSYDKTRGINKIETDSWTKLSEIQQRLLIDSFVDLYANNYKAKANIDTNAEAQALFNYLLVKDGGQFASSTFIKFMPVFMFKDYMSQLDKVNRLFSGAIKSKAEQEEVFGEGITGVNMLQEYLKGYLTHAANEYNLRRIKKDSDTIFPAEGTQQMIQYGEQLKKLTKESPEQAKLVEEYDGYTEAIQETDSGLSIDLLAGVRKKPSSARFSTAEKFMRDQNWFYLNQLGFDFGEKKTVQFPYAIRYNNELYTLVSIERRVEGREHEIGTVDVNQLLKEGEFVPSAVKATYTKDSFRGSSAQFGAGFVLPGTLPLNSELKGAPAEKVIAQNISAAKDAAEEFNNQYNIGKNSNNRIIVFTKEGVLLEGDYANKLEAINALIKEGQEKPEASQATLSGPNDIKGEIATKIITDWVMKGLADLTIRGDNYHKEFYKGDGLYTMDNGEVVEVKEIGIAKRIKDKAGDRIVIKAKDGKEYNMSLDEFGRREGFGNWDGFDQRSQYSQKFIDGKETRHLYTIKLANKKEEGTGTQAPVPGVESIPNTGISVEKANSFIDIIKNQIALQAYRENVGKNANLMFNFGMSWGRKGDTRFPNRGEAVKIDSKAGPNGRYIYSKTDQEGKALPSIKELQPIMDYIQSKLGIDMSAYDVVIGNLYEPGTFISQHSDIDESKSAENYPVVVINLGAGGPFVIGTDAGSKTINLENGGVYAFGINGENRWVSHRTVDQFTSPNPLQPVVAQGKIIKDYRVTLTFRRASDLEKGMPATPKKLSTTQSTQAPVSETTVSAPKTGRWTPEQWKAKVNELYSKGMFLFAGPSSGATIIDRTKLTPEEFNKRANAAIKEMRDRGISDDNSIFEALSCPF